MAIITTIKNYVRRKSIEKRLKEKNRKKHTCSLDSANSIGVLFSYHHDLDFNTIREFLAELSKLGKKVFALGYIDDPENFSSTDLFANINYFNKKELNWFDKPESEAVEEFIKRDFDIMFTLTTERIFPLEYVNQASLANFKVSFPEYLELGSDFCLEVENKTDLKYYLEQLLHYLKMIK